jgi:hypothetical protein
LIMGRSAQLWLQRMVIDVLLRPFTLIISHLPPYNI